MCPGNKKSPRNKRNRKKNVQGKIKFQDDLRLDDVIHRLCIPNKTSHLVYHTKSKDHESLAFDWPSKNKIEYVNWTIKKGIHFIRTYTYILYMQISLSSSSSSVVAPPVVDISSHVSIHGCVGIRILVHLFS